MTQSELTAPHRVHKGWSTKNFFFTKKLKSFFSLRCPGEKRLVNGLYHYLLHGEAGLSQVGLKKKKESKGCVILPEDEKSVMFKVQSRVMI